MRLRAEEVAEGGTGNLKGREEKAGREEQGFRPALGLSSSSPFGLQEVPDERNGSGVPGTDTAPGQRKRGRGQAAKALNPSPGKLDSTRCDEEPRKGLEAGMDTSLASAREKDLRAALKQEAESGLLSSGQSSGKGAGARGLLQWLGQTLECTFLVGVEGGAGGSKERREYGGRGRRPPRNASRAEMGDKPPPANSWGPPQR